MIEKTKKELRADLVAALRSGNYEQAKGALCRVDRDETTGKKSYAYCCLGVACDLVEKPSHEDFVMLMWGEGLGASHTILPRSIMEVYGFKTQSGSFKLSDGLRTKFPKLPASRPGEAAAYPYSPGEYWSCLTGLNDKLDWTFKEIADLIEYEPEGMFTD